jgi:hypothetical protein
MAKGQAGITIILLHILITTWQIKSRKANGEMYSNINILALINIFNGKMTMLSPLASPAATTTTMTTPLLPPQPASVIWWWQYGHLLVRRQGNAT